MHTLLAVSVFLGASLISQAAPTDCGGRGERCCTLDDGELPQVDKSYGTDQVNAREIDQAQTPEARFCKDVQNDVCDPESDTCVDEDTLNCGGEGEPCCDMAVDIGGDYPSQPLCFDTFRWGFNGDYSYPDLYCDTNDNICKDFSRLTNCGNPGLPCCTDKDRNTSENWDFYVKYATYSPYCVDSYCTNGICEPCNFPGAKCCGQDSDYPTAAYCVEPTQCVEGTCEECGGLNMPCCEWDESYNGANPIINGGYWQYGGSPCVSEEQLECVNNVCVEDACGERGQRCCTRADGRPPKITGTVARRIKQGKTDKARFCNDYDNDVCDPVSDTCVDENTLNCGEIGEACCDMAVDIGGDYPSRSLCFDTALGYGFAGEYNSPDVYCDTNDNICKLFQDLTNCGNPGLRCCTKIDRATSENDDFYSKNTVFSRFCDQSFCTKGICEPCSSPGDKCCDVKGDFPSPVPFCVTPNVCIQGTCESCGNEGEACCDFANDYDTSSEGGATIDVEGAYQEGGPDCVGDDLQCVNNKCVKA